MVSGRLYVAYDFLLPHITPDFISLSFVFRIVWSSTRREGVGVGGHCSPYRSVRRADVAELDAVDVPVERAGSGRGCK